MPNRNRKRKGPTSKYANANKSKRRQHDISPEPDDEDTNTATPQPSTSHAKERAQHTTSHIGVSGGNVQGSFCTGTYDGTDNPILFANFPGPPRTLAENLATMTQPKERENQTKERENTILHIQAFKGALELVEFILSQDVIDLECRGVHGRTPVMMAALNGMLQVVKYLKEAGCRLDMVDDYGNNILHIACIGGSIEMISYILSLKIPDVGPESKGEFGRTPVMMAADNGHSSAIDLLLKHGCHLSVHDEYNNNILHIACLGGSQVIVGFILSQKIAGIESQGRYGRTPVMHAVAMTRRTVADLLIKDGCDLSTVDGENNNILHIACIAGNVELVKYIHAKSRLDIDSKGKLGWTPVMMAADKGHKDVFDYLVGKECDLEVIDENGNNVFHIASIGGNVEIVEYLRKSRVASEMMKENKFGVTPLKVALSQKQDNIVNFYFKCNEVNK